jgi:uroporphyrinogen-III synthase
VAITRDEPDTGPLHQALGRRGFATPACPVLTATAPAEPEMLMRAATRLHQYAWVICASARAVEALCSRRSGPWPATLRSAAVGHATAAALVAHGATPPPVVADRAGADALWQTLAPMDAWIGLPVLVLTTEGGRTSLIEGLAGAGARVDVVEAYRMTPRPAEAIRADWAAAAPDAVVLASPRTATALVEAVGPDALSGLRAVVAIGGTTAGALAERGVPCRTSPSASFEAVAEMLARLQEEHAPARPPQGTPA